MRVRTRILLGLLALSSSPAWAIFTNGGFESGNFTGWTKTIGQNFGLSGSAPFNGGNIVISPGGSDTSAIVGAITDPRAPQLVFPRAGTQTARINDSGSGYVLNSIKQSAPITNADIDGSDGKLHVRFSYAPVLEDPGHSPNSQPYFYVSLKNVTKGTLLYGDFTFSNQPGITFITTVVGGSPWKSTNFINVDIVVPMADLNDTLEIEALAADCAAGAHGGYVYLDGFGSIVVPPGGGGGATYTDPIPTMTEWALILMAFLLATMGTFHLRKGSRR